MKVIMSSGELAGRFQCAVLAETTLEKCPSWPSVCRRPSSPQQGGRVETFGKRLICRDCRFETF